MPACTRCGEEIVWAEEDGKYVPYSMQIHWKSPKHIQAIRGKPKAKRPAKRSNEDNEVFDMLTAQWDAKRARALLPLVTGNTLEEKLRSALKIVAAESPAKGGEES